MLKRLLLLSASTSLLILQGCASANIYRSPFGFEMKYPPGWEVSETKSWATPSTQIQFFPKGALTRSGDHTYEQRKEVIRERGLTVEDVETQAIIMYVEIGYQNYEKAAKNLSGLSSESLLPGRLHDPGFVAKQILTESGRIILDGKPAIFGRFKDPFYAIQGISVFLLANPVEFKEDYPLIDGTKTKIPGFPIGITYMAKDSSYSEKTALESIQSFEEHIGQILRDTQLHASGLP